jgi:competence protein ComEA
MPWEESLEKKGESKGKEMNKATFGALLVLASLAAAPARAQKAAGGADVSGVINVNSATAEQIAFLPRVGIKLAERVVEYRKSNGPFKKIEDLMEVKGVGEKLFVALKPHLTVSGTTTLTQKIKSTGMRSRGKTTRAAKAA